MSRVNDKVTVKEILIDKYEEVKEKYWSKVPKIMREHVDNLVKKSITCVNIENRFAQYVYED